MERAADDGSNKSVVGFSEEDRRLRGRLTLRLAQVSGPPLQPMMNSVETAGSRRTASDGSEQDCGQATHTAVQVLTRLWQA